MLPTPDDFLQAWVGWRRYSFRVWSPICSAGTEEACRQALARTLPAPDDPDGEELCLPAGDTPIA